MSQHIYGSIEAVRKGDKGDPGSRGPAGAFWATYGSTTNSAIDAALDAGEMVYCNYQSVIYALSFNEHGEGYSEFTNIDYNRGMILHLECVSGVWSNSEKPFTAST